MYFPCSCSGVLILALSLSHNKTIKDKKNLSRHRFCALAIAHAFALLEARLSIIEIFTKYSKNNSFTFTNSSKMLLSDIHWIRAKATKKVTSSSHFALRRPREEPPRCLRDLRRALDLWRPRRQIRRFRTKQNFVSCHARGRSHAWWG